MENTWQGNEFKEGDNAILDCGHGRTTPVTVIRWDKWYGGWWYVRLQNGGLHYTRLLIKNK